jgi:hypothetical protein
MSVAFAIEVVADAELTEASINLLHCLLRAY